MKEERFDNFFDDLLKVLAQYFGCSLKIVIEGSHNPCYEKFRKAFCEELRKKRETDSDEILLQHSGKLHLLSDVYRLIFPPYAPVRLVLKRNDCCDTGGIAHRVVEEMNKRFPDIPLEISQSLPENCVLDRCNRP